MQKRTSRLPIPLARRVLKRSRQGPPEHRHHGAVLLHVSLHYPLGTIRVLIHLFKTKRHRNRRRQGTRCIIVDVSALEISALVVRGYLPEEARTDPKAIKLAIEGVISDMAFELEQERSERRGSGF